MAIFKCKMCGGTLEINSETIATCEYCGTQQTLPKLNDGRRANLYDRANHFRRNNEFDKAMGIYEQILNDDNTDAESYWSLVLCRYGIEYVEDPATHKRVPTVNRAQFTSIFDDDNYKSALQYADGAQRHLYEEEAKVINEIQKGILAISQKEEPFDVFICYKETDKNGRRTPDSVLANELYHQLTQEGFKVFFSRITLEDKLGVAYEPYIFAALNSAKVMVVVGTKQEYFNAVWVKNEWSRYLALIKGGANKILIPSYRDMDPYDLPDEFSHLQAQDMSKLGFMQDLIRGIKKITAVEVPKNTVVKETATTSGNGNIVPLLKRAFMFLEDGDWKSADEYCEKVLDIDPECAQAYLGKLMAELHVRKQESLKDCAQPFDSLNNYQKTIRFANGELRAALMGYIDHINERNEQARMEGIYLEALKKMGRSSTEEEYKATARMFNSIKGYRDAASQTQKCYDKAVTAKRNAIYNSAKEMMAGNQIANYQEAIKRFETIPDWKDSSEQIAICQQRITEIKAQKERERLAAEAAAKRNKKIAIIVAPIVCAVIVFVIILNTVIIPNNKYNDAVALMDAGQHEEAIAAFEALKGYKDSATKILDIKYSDAIALMDASKYTEAIAAFEALEGYKDSVTKINECNTAILDAKYNDAIALMDAGNIVEAYEALIALDGYKDSTEKANSIYGKYKLKTIKVGDYVFLGKYEQDYNTSNGKEDIEWLVLEVNNGKALVISKYALDCKQYNPTVYQGRYADVTWETCALRKWLNNDFINTAFSSGEKAIISTATVSADKNPNYGTDPGKATKDQVFLLSIPEANKYFSSDNNSQCKPTFYAQVMGVPYYPTYDDCCNWWLRSPGSVQGAAAYVSYEGDIVEAGGGVGHDKYAVRPALWINLPE